MTSNRKTDRAVSPLITSLAWGTVRVEGNESAFKDVKLYPGGAREWDWNETGTRHQPGIQPEDVAELIEHGARHVILSRGMQRRLQVRPDTLDELREAGIRVEVLETTAAADRYNNLAENEPVGALIHSTC